MKAPGLLLLLASLSLNAAPIQVAPPAIVPDVTTGFGRPVVSAAASTSQFFVTWEERSNPFRGETGRVRFRMYGTSGAPLQALPVTMAGGTSPSVIWTGEEWLVTWGRYFGSFPATVPIPYLFAGRVDMAGNVVTDPLVIGKSVYGTTTTVARGNGSALVSGGWTTSIVDAQGNVVRDLDTAYTPLAEMNGRYLAKKGDVVAMLDPLGNVLATTPMTNILAAAAHAGIYAIAQRTDAGLAVTRLQPNGAIVDTTSYPTADALDALSGASMTWSNGAFVVALAHAEPANRLCTVRIEGTGTTNCLSSGFPVRSVSVAANSQALLVAWSESHGSTDQVRTTVLPGTTDIATAQRQPQTTPSMIGDTIVWSEPDTTPRAMIGGVGRAPRVLASPAIAPVRMARGNGESMAVWSTGGASPQIYEREVLDDGTLAPPLLLGAGTDPSIAFDGEDWLIAWRSTAGHITTAFLRGRLLIGPIIRDLDIGGVPVVASRGKDFLVVGQSTTTHYATDAVLVDRNGIIASPIMELAGALYPMQLALAGSGDLYLLGVTTLNNTISLAPTSTIPGILVSGNLERIHPHSGGGFAAISGSRFVLINALGDVTLDTTLPVPASDFVEENGRIDVVYGNGELLFDSFALKRRAAGMR